MKNEQTAIGRFLRKTVPALAPGILEAVGHLTGVSMLGKISELIGSSKVIDPVVKSEAMKTLAVDMQRESEQITKRHSADMSSDSWLPKNIRPLTLAYLLIQSTVLAVMDGLESVSFTLAESYRDTYGALLISAVGFYFVVREIKKYAKA